MLNYGINRNRIRGIPFKKLLDEAERDLSRTYTFRIIIIVIIIIIM